MGTCLRNSDLCRMRLFHLTLAVLLAALSAVSADPNPQFFEGIRNFFSGRPRRPNPPPNRPPPLQQQPPPQQQPPQQQAPRQPPPQQQFRQPPRQPVQNRPPPRQPVQQSRPPPQETFRRPAQTVNRPPPQQVVTQPPATPAPAPSCNPAGKSSLNGCPGACPNEFDDQGRPYILTWKINDKECSNFTGIEAEEYCRLQGGHAVSLDDNEKALHFRGIAIRDRRRYFWTGGRIDHSVETVTWPSGKREGYIRGQRFWSHTGGNEPVPEPQPDNRDGNEVCIGVLNNFYADGVKWHDVACHHRKPTICEL